MISNANCRRARGAKNPSISSSALRLHSPCFARKRRTRRISPFEDETAKRGSGKDDIVARFAENILPAAFLSGGVKTTE
jgi:hypothetical protein